MDVLDAGPFKVTTSFSPGSDPTFLEYTMCGGHEVDLLSCAKDRPLGLAQCPHSEDVGLICPGKLYNPKGNSISHSK